MGLSSGQPVVEPPGWLYQRLRTAGEQFSTRPALTFVDSDGESRTYSFDESYTAAEELSARLPSDIPAGPVGILVDRQDDQVLHFLALLCAGRVPAILTPPNRKLDARYYAETNRAVLARVGFAAIITELEGLEGAAPLILSPRDLTIRHAARSSDDIDAAGLEDAAFLQFSSGTTGIKKGVAVGPEAIIAQLDAYGQSISIDPDDVIVSWLPLYHDMGFITALHLPLWHGAHAVMQHPIDWVERPSSYFSLVTQHRATLGWHPNFAYKFMADRVRDLSSYDLSSLRGLANCSEPAIHGTQAGFHGHFGTAGLSSSVFWGCYAMAETTFAVTHSVGTETVGLDHEGPLGQSGVPRPVVTTGTPLSGVDVRVEGSEGDTMPAGECGEVVIAAPFLASRYYNNPEATSAAFRDGSYRTGDLGYRIGDQVYVTGRLKDLIIVAGVNVHPGDVEALVSEEPGVQSGRVAAFAHFDERAGTERIVILYEKAEDGGRVDMAGLRRRLIAALELSNFEIRSVPAGWLVKSSSGKMARSTNRDKWWARRSGTAALG